MQTKALDSFFRKWWCVESEQLIEPCLDECEVADDSLNVLQEFVKKGKAK
jgi:hypothetical protein